MTKAELHEAWSYRFEYWTNQHIGFDPVRLVESRDESESYEMNAAHVFENESGNFSLVTECGCSCYGSEDAQVDFYPTEEIALAAMNSYFKRYS